MTMYVRTLVSGNNDSFIEPSCIPFDQTEPIPYNTTEYADMCMDYVGVPPTIDCGDGVTIPIYVNGEEVTEDQPPGECDDTDFRYMSYRFSCW